MYIEHVAIWSSNIEISKDFYIKYFEAVSNEKYISKNNPGFESYFLKFNNGSRLEIMQHPNINQKNNFEMLGFAHIAFAVKNKQEFDELINRMQKENVKIISQPRLTGDGYYEACVLDPDNNKVEIIIQNF